jgi:hypothetical protein
MEVEGWNDHEHRLADDQDGKLYNTWDNLAGTDKHLS